MIKLQFSISRKKIKSFYILESLFNSEYSKTYENLRVKDIYSRDPLKDPTHANTIQYITRDMAESADFINHGELLVCLRNMNLIVAIDVDREVVTWATTGPWHRPHEPTVTDNGNILIFDNRSQWPLSRVIEFSPKTNTVVWEYQGPQSRPLRSVWMGRQQLLRNGNILITDSASGRLLEVTRNGELVWEYINPERIQDNGQEKTWDISFGYRFQSKELTFLNIQ